MSQLITPELTPAPEPPVPEKPVPAPAPKTRPAFTVSRDIPAKTPAPQPANDIHRSGEPQEAPRGSWTKYAAAAAILLLAGAGGLYVLRPADKPPAAFEATAVPLRQAAVEEKPPAPAPSSVAEPAQTAPAPSVVAPPPAPTPAATEARNEAKAPAPDAPAPNASSPNGPVPGMPYKVLKGDMLSVIARQAYGNASLYPLIQRANPGLRNADRIYYDQVITLPPAP